ncbi:hypothetical protein CEXT_450541 [Caerostris extrusa]|uniref:Uncharacterized protein n=1 Tax=Caerostris extrusa TaxID=172846 RepID=A0AAV4YEK9_CAEEX|nr:hypothetical protein CEXT_450541 [Caerostris extrusa]
MSAINSVRKAIPVIRDFAVKFCNSAQVRLILSSFKVPLKSSLMNWRMSRTVYESFLMWTKHLQRFYSPRYHPGIDIPPQEK